MLDLKSLIERAEVAEKAERLGRIVMRGCHPRPNVDGYVYFIPLVVLVSFVIHNPDASFWHLTEAINNQEITQEVQETGR